MKSTFAVGRRKTFFIKECKLLEKFILDRSDNRDTHFKASYLLNFHMLRGIMFDVLYLYVV